MSNRYKKRYTGGSPADYEGWGLEAPHFIWVSPYAGDAPNEVVVYGEVDNETDGIPTSGQLATLLSYLSVDPVTGLANRRPVGDEVQCLPITRKIFDFHISIKGANATTKTNIETALAEYMAELEPYNEGVTIERNDAITDSAHPRRRLPSPVKPSQLFLRCHYMSILRRALLRRIHFMAEKNRKWAR